MGEKKKVFKSREIKIAIFALVGLFLLIWGINFLKGIDIFKKQYPYYVIFEKTSGLMPAHLVTINGMSVGNVDDIKLMPELSNRVLVTINVNKGIQIPLNSIIRIGTPDLLSSPQVEILFSDEQTYIQKGDTVWGTISPGMLDGLNGLGDVVSNVDTIMIAAKNLMQSDAMDSLKAAIADFHSITQNIDNILKDNAPNINVAVSDLQSFASMLKENNNKITNIIEKISTVSDNLAEAEIKQAIDSLSMVVGRVHAFVDNMNDGKGTLGQLVVNDSLYISLNNSLISLDRLLEDLKANPKKYINVTVFGRKEKKEK
jgi:phospholipid/cholesterol/gamma-HCH transport system substrate-binding protein